MSTSMFSWSDSIHAAFSSCLPCLSHPRLASSPSQQSLDQNPHDPTVNRVRRARADELQGLLADVDTDTEAERMSLHSNPGINRKKRTRKKKGKKITLFGYDLFGRPTPPIHLQGEDNLGVGVGAGPSHRTRTESSSTLDSDAAPLELDPDTIARISDLELATQRAQAIEAEQAKQQRRRERKERKRLAKALAHGRNHTDPSVGGFEGFQGGGGYLSPPPVYTYGNEQDAHEEYGTYVQAPYSQQPPVEDEDEDGEAPDFDGGLYDRRTGANGPSGSRSNSDSRSRTSGSRSQPDVQHTQSIATLPASPSPRKSKSSSSSSSSKSKSKSKSSVTSSTPSLSDPTSKSKSKSKSRSMTSGSSHTSTAQSPLAPPASAAFPSQSNTSTSLPFTPLEDDFDGTQGFSNTDLGLDPEPIPEPIPIPDTKSPTLPKPSEPQELSAPTSTFPSKGFGRSAGNQAFPSQGFPSAGFGAGAGKSIGGRRPRDTVHALGGAFLATRGDAGMGGRGREGGL